MSGAARPNAAERVFAGLATIVLLGSAVGHLKAGRWMARKAAWRYSPHYQREIAFFDLAHAAGTAAAAAGRRPDPVHVGVVSLTALLLGLNHAAAIRAGDSGGALNWTAAVGNTVAGSTGLALAARQAGS
jgi:hypothetical protein